MTRQHLLAAVLIAAAGVSPAKALGAPTGTNGPAPSGPVFVKPVGPESAVSATSGQLDGLVTDNQGKPLAGVAVTAFGPKLDFAVTDTLGRYVFQELPSGTYVLQARASGFGASGKLRVDVHSGQAARIDVRLAPASAGARAVRRPVLAAAVGAQDDPQNGPEDQQPPESHSDTAWRLRHLNRSVLRNEHAGEVPRAEVTPAAANSTVLPFLDAASAQLQLLTISAFDRPDEIFSGARVPDGVAFVSLSAPLGAGTWAVQGAMTQGEVSSWVVGGRYATRFSGGHATEIGMSYAAQRYDGGNPDALAAMGETSRTVGAMYASDRWTVSRNVLVTGNARFEHYGYIDRNGLFSPSAEVRWEPASGHAFRALVAQHMTAPGAEEFVPSPLGGLWMPPERTFSSLRSAAAFRPERSRHVEVGYEKDIARFVVAARGFRQEVNDQVVTVFGLQTPNVPRADLGHYFTGSAGSADAYGWGLSVISPASSRWRGSVAYSVAQAKWASAPSAPAYWVLARSSTRPSSERIQDLTTSVETDIRETATRLLAVYKLSSGFAADQPSDESTTGGRFEFQVNQRLPFVPIGDAEWELLVAVKNLFREEIDGASIFDELLVVRPPKRFVGGLLIRF